VVITDQTRAAKNIFENKSESRRKVARARLRWVETVENDLRQPNVEGWRENANNGQEMECAVKEANVLRVSSS
jgi:hypothetical protein